MRATAGLPAAGNAFLGVERSVTGKAWRARGADDRAALALEQALQLGYRDFAWLARDPDLKKLRDQPVYRDLQNKIRRMKIKVR